MKVPELKSVEGIALLCVAAFAAYTLYKVYEKGSSLAGTIKQGVTTAYDDAALLANKVRTAATGGNFATPSEDQSAAETARLLRLEREAYMNEPVDPTEPTYYNAMGDFMVSGLGVEGPVETVPQTYSPSSDWS